MNAITPIRPTDWTGRRAATSVHTTIHAEQGLWIELDAEAGQNVFRLSQMTDYSNTVLRIPIADAARLGRELLAIAGEGRGDG